MATVPGNRLAVLPSALQPTQADILIAAHMHMRAPNYGPDDPRHGGMWDDPETAQQLRERNIKEDYPNLYNRSRATQPKIPKQEEPGS